MLREGIPLGRLFGIPIRLHYSWFIIFALTTWGFSQNLFPAVYPHWSSAESIAAAVVTSLLFFASLLAHELMHSLVAQHYGIPVKAITLFILGGVSQITEEPHAAPTEFRIAIVGPLTSTILGGIFWGLGYLLPPAFEVVAVVSLWLGWINIVLAVFNMVPGFPLDGGRVLHSILWWRTGNLRRATKLASNVGRGTGFILIFGGIWLAYTGNWMSGVWISLIGWYLVSTSASSYNQMRLQQALEGHSVSEVISADCISVAYNLSIERLVNDYIVPTRRRCFAVVREGMTVGLITLQEVKGVLRDMRPSVIVAQVMRPLDKLKQVTLDEDLSTVLTLLSQENVNQVPVMLDGRMIGMVTRENLISFMKQRDRKNA